MASTYTQNNKMEKPGVGEQAGGSWGATTNINFDLIDTAIDGFSAVAISGTTHALNIPDATAAIGRNKVLSFTGALTAANTVTISPNTVEKLYFLQNNTTGGQNVIIAQGSGSTVTIKPGYSSIVYLDGAGAGASAKEVLTSLRLTALLEAAGILLAGSVSGNTALQASAAASGTLTLPAATDTLVGRATTDTLSNKTLASPIITTNATVPLVIGGTSTTSPLTLRSTSGVGTAGADIVFQTGNNGATEAGRFTNAGRFAVGTNNPEFQTSMAGIGQATANITDSGSRGAALLVSDLTALANSGGAVLLGGSCNNGLTANWGIKSLLQDGNDNGVSHLVFMSRTARVNTSLTEVARFLNDGKFGLGVTPAFQFQLSTDSAAKPSTNTWTIASDARLKTVLGDYEKGLDAICALRPVRYRNNGLGGMPADGKEHISIIAQEAQEVFPECIGTFSGKLREDDEEETELLNYNGHAVTFALINAVRELKARIEELESQIGQ